MAEEENDDLGAEELTRLGDRNLDGEVDRTPENPWRAFELYLNAAKRGHPPAMWRVAQLYMEGKGIERSIAHAREWLQRGADSGDSDSMFRLGQLMGDFEAGPNYYNPEQAIYWFVRAADAGLVASYFHVARAYWLGEGVAPDAAQASLWAERGSAAGDDECDDLLEQMHEQSVLESAVDERDYSPQTLTQLNKQLDSVIRRIARGAGNIEELTVERDALREKLARFGGAGDFDEAERQ